MGSIPFPREYWMIYRGPGFLAVLWFGSSKSPPPLPSVRSTGDTQEDLLTGEEGRRRSQIIRQRESLVLYKNIQSFLSLPAHTPPHYFSVNSFLKVMTTSPYSRPRLFPIRSNVGVGARICTFWTLKMSLWWDVVFATFQAIIRWKHIGELYFLEFAANLLGGPPYFLLVHWMNSWLPISPVLRLQYNSLTWEKPIGGSQRNVKKLRVALEYDLPVHRNILKSKWWYSKAILESVIQ
jgi:hypothetical protein